VIRPYVTERVLVLDRIDGRKIDADHGLGADRAHELARQFFRAYVHLEQAMRSTANRIGGAVIVAALLIASALLARVHDLRWYAFAGFCAAFALGIYMVWKIIRTPGEL
jgi:hypothetical protein